MKITGMKINGICNPIGFLYEKLLCSWKVTETFAKKQKFSCIEISKMPDFKEIIYKKEGRELDCCEAELSFRPMPYTTYYWRVTVEAFGGERAVSNAAFFETGKMDMPWKGKWIGTAKEDTFHPVLKKSFQIVGMPVRARLYICGLGLYEAYLNGTKIGCDYLAPFLNDYLECYQYQTYDITDLLSEENEFRILLGKGWYMGVFGLQNKPELFGNEMMAIAELHIEYEDRETEVIATDDTWLYQGSDIEESGIYYGEIFNRLLWKERKNPWKKVIIKEAPGNLVERYSLPVCVKEELSPINIIHTPAGELVLDMGQNHAGYMEFEADFAEGTKIVFECGEVLQNGNFYHENYRDAQSVFIYISDGRKETVRPHFTYFGYRYLKVSGWPGELQKEDIRAKVVYSDLERTGYIETSDEKINRLYQNCLWSQKSNFIDLPTDCPQRSERLGWTGDAQVFSPTASCNMDTRAFYRKYLRDLRSEQLRAKGAVPNYIPSIGDYGGAASVWGDAAVFIPEQLYIAFGNIKEMEDYYPLMHDWVEYLYCADEETGGKRLLLNRFQFGDWLALDGITEQSFKGGTEDNYIGSVYYYQSVKLTAQMAERLGYSEDAGRYKKLAKEIFDAVLAEYFTLNGRLAMDTQAAYIIALKFGIYKDREKLIAQFKERMRKDCYQIRCGFVGAPLLCTTLCENGMEDLAYHFLFQEEFPSWLYCVNLGATTIWERWNSLLEDGTVSGTGMNSFNHYSYGSVVEFLYSYIAGIRAEKPGYQRAVIAPVPDMRFRYFNCTYHSASGKYVSNWKIAENGIILLHVEIPFNCKARVILPRYNKQQFTGYSYEERKVKNIGDSVTEDGKIMLCSGIYEFSYMPDKDYRQRYDVNTRLVEVADDEEVLSILKEELPAAYEIILRKDKENENLTFGELGKMFFLGFDEDMVKDVTNKIYTLKRW